MGSSPFSFGEPVKRQLAAAGEWREDRTASKRYCPFDASHQRGQRAKLAAILSGCRKFSFAISTRGTRLARNAYYMIGALEILRRERDEAAEQIRMMRNRIKDLDAAISVLEGQPFSAKPGRTAGDLKLSVLKQLSEVTERGGTPKEIADALTRGGRQTSDASVSSTLSRLKAESKVINRGGRWFAANHSAEAQHSESRGSGFATGWDDLDDDMPL